MSPKLRKIRLKMTSEHFSHRSPFLEIRIYRQLKKISFQAIKQTQSQVYLSKTNRRYKNNLKRPLSNLRPVMCVKTRKTNPRNAPT